MFDRAILEKPGLLAAFSLSLAAHAGLVYWFNHSAGGGGRDGNSIPGSASAPISVWLKPAVDRRAEQSPASLTPSSPKSEALESPVAKEVKKEEPATSPADNRVVASNPAVPLPVRPASALPAALPEPHYFSPEELTEKPHVVQDIPSPYVPSLPDVFTRPIVVRLLINDRGDVDKVVIEKILLSQKAVHFIEDTFSKVKFLPGKIGGMSVRSQIAIEISLENSPLAAPPVVLKP